MKAFYALSLLFWRRYCSVRLAGTTSDGGSTSTRNSGPSGAGSCERGFLLLFLCPLLLLAVLVLAFTVKLIDQTHERVATQSRLDLCAVELAVGREQLFARLVKTNTVLNLTGKGIAVARGLMFIGGPAVALLSKVGEQGLLLANKGAYLEQQLEIYGLAAKELTRTRCRADEFSNRQAFCLATPALAQAFRRDEPWMPDVKGEVHLRSDEKEVSRIRCFSAQLPPLKTTLTLEGDPELGEKKFTDAYEE